RNRFDRIGEVFKRGRHAFRLDLPVLMPMVRARALEVIRQADGSGWRIQLSDGFASVGKVGELVEKFRADGQVFDARMKLAHHVLDAARSMSRPNEIPNLDIDCRGTGTARQFRFRYPAVDALQRRLDLFERFGQALVTPFAFAELTAKRVVPRLDGAGIVNEGGLDLAGAAQLAQ